MEKRWRVHCYCIYWCNCHFIFFPLLNFLFFLYLWSFDNWNSLIHHLLFSATFAKIGYQGLKNILEKNEINYTRFTIVQASQVKKEWEIMNCKERWSDKCINICSSNVPFNKIPFSEECNFIFHKKLTKKPAIQYKIVSETHRIWDELYSTDLRR